MAKKRQSFSDAILERPAYYIGKIFEKNPNIKRFEEFDDAFRTYMDSVNGKNADLDEQDIINLFKTHECKSRIKENTTSKELDEAYGDGNKVTYERISKKKAVRIVTKKVSAKGYQSRKGKSIKPYSRTYSGRFTNVEKKFLIVRKKRGMSRKQIIKEYQTTFKNNERTSSSISSKIYRI